jgi:hypothetical protein
MEEVSDLGEYRNWALGSLKSFLEKGMPPPPTGADSRRKGEIPNLIQNLDKPHWVCFRGLESAYLKGENRVDSFGQRVVLILGENPSNLIMYYL